ncbi:MAG TPA: glycosyltransferase family 39 protein [Bacteroidia bacterium]|jgi:tetratricopeptide (TPR) repeat protein|nr:glycosyltransferase family 39 protein [Bacteroidia bacterium]
MQQKKKKPAATPPPQPKPALSKSIFGFDFKVKCFILLGVAFAFYANSIFNEFALDDGIVITQNEYVQQGFSGIKKILSTDAYDSYYRSMHANQMLAGGRYRPLSIVVFAIEHSIFGESWTAKHIFSVIFYMLCIFSIFYFLSKYLLKKLPYGEDMAFVATLLFAIHPIHTEVVANVKSLDEILSLSLIMATCIFSLRYLENKKNKDLVLGLVAYLLALLAKEYAVMMIFLLPLLFYTLTNKKPFQSVMAALPYVGVMALYMLMRIGSIGFPHNVPSDEILNNPYMLAKGTQKIATEWFVLGKYLYTLFVPYPLSSDYSYAQIPYYNITDLPVLFTLLIYIGFTYWGIKLALKRNVLAFAIFFYLFNIAMVSNFLVDIGATMGERLAFHSSLGFVILLTYGAFKLINKMQLETKRNVLTGVLAILILACGAETIQRNAEWKNDVTLFTTDVNTVPNSVMVNGNAGARFIDIADKSKDSAKTIYNLRLAIKHLAKSISLDKTYTTSYLNLGVVYFKLSEPDSAKMCWDYAKRLYPNHPRLKDYYALLGQCYLSRGLITGKNSANIDAAIQIMRKGIPYDSTNANIWYNIGGAYFTIRKYDSARIYWTRTLQLKPDFKDAQRGMSALPPQK